MDRAVIAVLALSLAAPRAPAGDEWVKYRNDMGTLEFEVPPGFKEIDAKNANLFKFLQYEGTPYRSSQLKAYFYKGQTELKHFMKFVEKDVGGGNPVYETGSATRFTTDFQTPNGDWYVNLVEGKVEGDYGYYIRCAVKQDVFQETKDDWTRVLDSFKTYPPPKDAFTVPTGWMVVRNEFFAVMGPALDVKDPKLKQKFGDRLFRVQTWLDATSTGMKMIRTLANDRRQYVPRMPIHVLPTAEAFQAAAGDRWTEGAAVLYLPEHPEKVLLVDGSPDALLEERALAAEAGVQFMETRLGKTWPWLRAAFRLYFESAMASRSIPGAFPPEMLRKGKAAFAKPLPFEDLMKKDEAGMRELGEDGRIAAWGYLQCGLHGSDGALQNVFRVFLKEAPAGTGLDALWEKAVAGYKVEAKKTLRLKDIDAAAKKYFKELKEEKERK